MHLQCVHVTQCDLERVAAAVTLPCARPTTPHLSIDGSNGVAEAHVTEQGGYMRAQPLTRLAVALAVIGPVKLSNPQWSQRNMLPTTYRSEMCTCRA
jgi:hypothetical protein